MKIIQTGIDISRWQGDFAMDEAKSEGFTFAIIKGGGGDCGLYVDVKFARNYESSKQLGMNVGAYWFSKALTPEQAVKEADFFWEKCLKGRKFDLPVYMDVEHKSQLSLGKRQLTNVIHAFCQRLEEKGYFTGIYSSKSYFASYMIDAELQRYAHWVACWAKSCEYPHDSFGMWQYGGETNLIRSNRVAGQICDQNYMLIDYPALIRAAGKNGYTVDDSLNPEVSAVYSADLPVLRRGDKSNTVRALQILLIGNDYSCGSAGADGSFGPATENAVLTLQEDAALNNQDGVIGAEEWRILLDLP